MLRSFAVYSQNKDTLNIYHVIEERASRHKFTRLIYDAVFVDLTNNVYGDTATPVKVSRNVNPYSPFKGKVIRQINIITLDPFGYSVNDSQMRKLNRLEKIGNNFHITTRKNVIRNLLLFKNNKELDPLELSESERLLRLTPYINDARIYVKKVNRTDSVDVLVLVQDKWSTIIASNYNTSDLLLQVVEKNTLGIGHQFEEDMIWNQAEGRVNSYGRYSIYNNKNTYISSSVFYTDLADLWQLGISVNRPFYSPLTNWAGGIGLSTNYSVFNYVVNKETGELRKYRLDYNIEDVWLAKNFFTENKKLNLNERAKSYIAGLRYYHVDFFNKPAYQIDTNLVNQDLTMYLGNLGYTKRKYYRDRYLYRFGANEDIPQGISVEAVFGITKKELYTTRYYTGLKLAGGRHFNHLGYLSASFNYGIFYNSSFSGMGVINADALYFTDIIKAGKWFFRGFTRFKYVIGTGREPAESININGSQMYGFTSTVLTGLTKAIVNIEFITYAPYELLGFKFAPVLLCGLAVIDKNNASLW